MFQIRKGTEIFTQILYILVIFEILHISLAMKSCINSTFSLFSSSDLIESMKKCLGSHMKVITTLLGIQNDNSNVVFQ